MRFSDQAASRNQIASGVKHLPRRYSALPQGRTVFILRPRAAEAFLTANSRNIGKRSRSIWRHRELSKGRMAS
jgi:hypothetical protein